MKTMAGSAVAGIDVSKASLDVSVRRVRRVPLCQHPGGHRRPGAMVGDVGDRAGGV